jgi:hypothetical protein
MPAVLQSSMQWLLSNAQIRLGNPYVYGGMYSATVIGQGDDCSGDAGWGLQALTLGPQNMPLDANGNWIHTVNTESWGYNYDEGCPVDPGTVGPFGTIAIADPSDAPADAVAIVNIHHGGGGASSHMNLVLLPTNTILESNGGPTAYTDASKGQDGTGSCTNGTGGMESTNPYWTDHWYLPGPLLTVAPPTVFYADVSNNNWGGPTFTPTGAQQLTSFLATAKAMPEVLGVLHKTTEGANFVDPYWATFKGWCSDPANDFSWLGYHYVTLDDPTAQAANFVQAGGGQWVMLDHEQGSGGIDQFWAVTQAFNNAGVSVSMGYIPKWYWQQIGSPNLATLTSNQIALVASNYSGNANLDPIASYDSAGGNNAPGWAPFGGCLPTALQFTNAAVIGGSLVDLNAYNGLGPNLNALFTGAIFT